jgi:hypothetical protein
MAVKAVRSAAKEMVMVQLVAAARVARVARGAVGQGAPDLEAVGLGGAWASGVVAQDALEVEAILPDEVWASGARLAPRVWVV